jgi:hypothetical protein
MQNQVQEALKVIEWLARQPESAGIPPGAHINQPETNRAAKTARILSNLLY